MRCKNCGRVVPDNLKPPVRARCKNVAFTMCEWEAGPSCPVKQEPSFIVKVFSLCRAINNWIQAGRPVRSQARVEEILAICLNCEHLLDPGTSKQRCGVCGCPVNNNVENPKRNKLAMATEICPLTPPKWK